jgi:hypothetical protein
VERAALTGQQSAPDTQANQLSMQEEDLQLTAAPGARSVDVDDRRHRIALYRKKALQLYSFTALQLYSFTALQQNDQS